MNCISPRNIGTRGMAVGSLLPVLLLLSCNEPFPPYNDPRDVFIGRIEGLYVLTLNDNSMKVYIDLVNKYDETLEENVAIDGSVEIGFLRDPLRKKTFSLSLGSLISNGRYNAARNTLRIDPGDTVRFATSWNFVDNNGYDLRASAFQYYIDDACSQRCVANEEVFILSGQVKVFDKVPAITVGPVHFSVCYVKDYVAPANCPPVITSIPCSTRPSLYSAPCPPSGN